MASLDDILTTQKNGVIAINNLDQDIKSLLQQITIIAAHSFPGTVSATVSPSTTTQIYVGEADLFSVSIPIHSGSAQIYIYDSATTGGISNANLIYASLPSNAATFTPYQDVRLPVTNGIVLKTDAGMYACVAYTADVY